MTRWTKSISPPAFTLIEVLVVIIIIGLAAALVVPQMLRAGTMSSQGAARMAIADLLYAQNEAVAKQSPRRVVFDVANNRYRLTDGSGQTIAVSWKEGGNQQSNYVVDFAHDSRFQGVRLTNVNFNGEPYIEFDPLGSPKSGGSLDLVATESHYRITVAPMTGRVTVAPVTDQDSQ